MIGQGYSSIPRDNLVGEWLLNGDANDTSGNGNDGTATNMIRTTFDKIRFQKQYGTFNGSSSYINIGDVGDPGTSDWSFNCFFQTSNQATEIIVTKRFDADAPNAQRPYMIRKESSGLIIYYVNYNANLKSVTSTTQVDDGNLHMVTGVRDGDNIHIYIDTVLENTTSGVSTYNLGKANNAYIGRATQAASAYFNGFMYLCRMWVGKALNKSEIDSLYLEGLGKLGQY